MSSAIAEGPVSRRVLYTFLGVALVLCAELAWWVTFNVRSSQQQALAARVGLARDVALAENILAHGAAQPEAAGDIGVAPEVLQRFFPDLQLVAVSAQEARRAPTDFAAVYPGHRIRVRAEAVARVEQRHAAHTRMFLSEGGFFVAMLLLGVTLIFRTLRREVGIVRQQSNFLAAVSHELKSPLASIRLYTETMQLRQPNVQTCQRYLGIMRVDIDRLETLVGNLLAVARLDQGGFEARPTRVDIAAEIDQIVSDMQPDMQARGAALHLEIAERPVWAQIDPAVLNTVMRNLLDNAAKYNQHNAPVTVRLTAEAHSLCIEVIDRGIGLAADELSRIFTKFYRVGDEMVRQTEGSGLGLYLVASLWQHSGGKVQASSPGQGLGATFALVLPRAARRHSRRIEPRVSSR